MFCQACQETHGWEELSLNPALCSLASSAALPISGWSTQPHSWHGVIPISRPRICARVGLTRYPLSNETDIKPPSYRHDYSPTETGSIPSVALQLVLPAAGDKLGSARIAEIGSFHPLCARTFNQWFNSSISITAVVHQPTGSARRFQTHLRSVERITCSVNLLSIKPSKQGSLAGSLTAPF
jgi:hypothetical protein